MPTPDLLSPDPEETISPADVRRIRESLGMTLEDLARYLGLRRKSQAAHLESGRTLARGPVARLLRLLESSEGRILDGKIR